MTNKLRVTFLVLALILFSLTILGFFYLSTVSIAEESVSAVSYGTWLLIAYAAGLSMIVLPCTLPLVFIIVPMCMGKGYKKGLSIALLFGAGLIITITIYGLVIALLGQYAGIDRATQLMWFIAGIIAYVFGLMELKLITLALPAYMKTPKFIEKRGDYFKSFFMGLLLGNAGVGCPNPFFYFMLIYIMGTGSIVVGSSLGFVHGIGRAVPLIFIAILAILGISAANTLVRNRVAVEKATGWGLLFIGAFILLQGIFGHSFWERSPLHLAWNKLIASAGLSAEVTMGAHQIMPIPWTMFGLLIVIPIIWYVVRKKYDT